MPDINAQLCGSPSRPRRADALGARVDRDAEGHSIQTVFGW